MTILSDLNEQFEALDPQSRKAIIAIIEVKTERDMDKVLNRLETMDQKFEAMDQRFDYLNNKLDDKFSDVNGRIAFIQWAILVGFTIISLINVLPNFT